MKEHPLTTEQADELIRMLGLEPDDYELNEMGHVYYLEDGSSLVLPLSGRVIHLFGGDGSMEEYKLDSDSIKEALRLAKEANEHA